MNKSLKNLYISLIISCIPSIKIQAAAETENTKNTNQEQNTTDDDINQESIPYTKDDEELEKIKNDLVFDPVQQKWVSVKKMSGVQDKNKKEKNDGDAKLYEEAMVYDPKTNKWQKKSINNNLYKELSIPEEQSKTFLQNFSIGFSIGAGATFYRNSLNNLSILECKEKIYFQSQTQKEKGEATLINWFHDEYDLNKLFDEDEAKRLSEIDNDTNIYNSRGWSIPVTLFMDYTFCESWRIGLALVVEACIINKLDPGDGISTKVKPITNLSKDSLFIWNTRQLATFGYKAYTTENSDWLATLQIGPIYDKGIGSKSKDGSYRKNIISSDYRRMGLFMSIGANWELLLNGYCTLVSKLSYDFKHYKDDVTSNNVKIFGNDDAYVSLWQQTIKLEIGMRFTFAEN